MGSTEIQERRHGRSMVLTISEPVADWVKVLLRKTLDLRLSNCNRMECLVSDQGDIPRSMFAHLECLAISLMPRLSKLCDGPLPDGFLEKLRIFEVAECGMMTNILPSDIIPRVSQLEELVVGSCNEVEEVFDYGHNGGIIGEGPVLLPRLKTMYLEELDKLVTIWKGMVPDGSLGNLEQLTAWYCNSLRCIFPPAMASFPSLREVDLYGCNSLTSLFSWKQARGLQQLETLKVGGCDAVESIITSEDDLVEENRSMLPRLRRLELIGLPALTGFHGGGSKSSFDWPALEYISVKRCKELKKLAMGTQSAPKLEKMEGSEEWFQGLEWEDESIKSRLQTIFQPISEPISSQGNWNQICSLAIQQNMI